MATMAPFTISISYDVAYDGVENVLAIGERGTTILDAPFTLDRIILPPGLTVQVYFGLVLQGTYSATQAIQLASDVTTIINVVVTANTGNLIQALVQLTGQRPAGAGDAPTAVSLDDIKEYMRFVGNDQDHLLTTLLAAAQASIAAECDLLVTPPEDWPTLPRLAVKMLVAGWYTSPEGYTDKAVVESPAIRRIINLFKSWVPA